MKKVGFIDYFLKEWHADNYPAWIKEASNGEYQVCYGWGKIDNPLGGITNAQWCKENDVTLCASMEEVIEKSDVLIVLSPNNPEMHQQLCQLPLRSGKLTYVDKTFAPTKAIAQELFALAKEHHTTMWSSSALRFSTELLTGDIDKSKIDLISSVGPGEFEIYLIHQVEPIVALMGTDIKRLMYTGTATTPAVVLEFADGRKASLAMMPESPFALHINNKDNTYFGVPNASDFFPNFIKELVKFFQTGIAPVACEETITIMAVIEKAHLAKENPDTWIAL